VFGLLLHDFDDPGFTGLHSGLIVLYSMGHYIVTTSLHKYLTKIIAKYTMC